LSYALEAAVLQSIREGYALVDQVDKRDPLFLESGEPSVDSRENFFDF